MFAEIGCRCECHDGTIDACGCWSAVCCPQHGTPRADLNDFERGLAKTEAEEANED
jgi:hypothetical protein